jgi:hypothetical protein
MLGFQGSAVSVSNFNGAHASLLINYWRWLYNHTKYVLVPKRNALEDSSSIE